MSSGIWTDLPDRGVVAAAGPDARAFLQDLITTNMDRVAETGAGYGGLLTPQGKILFDFLVLADGDGYLFDIAADKAAEFARRLGFYRLRAKVEIADLSGRRAVLAGWDGAALPEFAGVVAADPRLAALGWRAVVEAAPEAIAGYGRGTPSAYAAHRIALGVPEGGADFAFGDAFPHDADMDQLGGIDFKKGCYVGQEVVSRMEHRGTARRRTIPVTGEAPLAAGAPVEAGGRVLGAVGSVDGTAGLATLRLDRARAALDAGEALTAGGIPLTVSLPGWARFGWPQDAGGED
jgi:folate-binding protein YgfZ